MANFSGTAGNDNFPGTANADLFKLHQGGDDIALGKGGNDEFRMGAALTAADTIDGGGGNDVLLLEGDYSAGLTFGASTMVAVETLKLKGAFSCKLALDDGNVGAGELLTVDATGLAAGATLSFVGGFETDGKFTILGSQSDDRVAGGHRADKFELTLGGDDHANGNGGSDIFVLGDQLEQTDIVTGGGGTDTVKVDGMAFTDTIVFNATTMTGVERLIVTADAFVQLVSANETVAAGATLFVDGSACLTNGFSFAGQLENNGSFDIVGGGLNGSITGGGFADTIQMSAHSGIYSVSGNDGGDLIACNAGEDHVSIVAAFLSSSVDHDTVSSFGFDGEDRMDLATTVTSVAATSGSISNATFDADLGLIIADSLAAGRAMAVTVTGGDLIGRTILVVDGNGTADYNPDSDYVIDVTGFSGTIDTTDFI